jgi:hypothetical protein
LGRVWQKRAVVWAHRVPAIFQTDQVSWDVKLDPDGASLAEFKGPA